MKNWKWGFLPREYVTSENLSQRLLSQFLIDFCKDTEDWLKEDKGMETVIFCPVYYLILSEHSCKRSKTLVHHYPFNFATRSQNWEMLFFSPRNLSGIQKGVWIPGEGVACVHVSVEDRGATGCFPCFYLEARPLTKCHTYIQKDYLPKELWASSP